MKLNISKKPYTKLHAGFYLNLHKNGLKYKVHLNNKLIRKMYNDIVGIKGRENE